MVALAAGILAQVDPTTSLWRAALAFGLGWFGATVWYVLIGAGRHPLEVPEVAAASPGDSETS